VNNIPDSDQSVILNDSCEPLNVSVIDLENTKENGSVKQNSVLAESKRKGKTKKKSKSVSSNNLDHDSVVNQQCDRSSVNPSSKICG
jgi:hypothetical protein